MTHDLSDMLRIALTAEAAVQQWVDEAPIESLNLDDVRFLLDSLQKIHDSIIPNRLAGLCDNRTAIVLDSQIHRLQGKLSAIANGGIFVATPF